MSEIQSEHRSGRASPWPIRLLNKLGSVWFGVAVLTVIFTYSSIGSALPPVRQGALADWLGLDGLRFEKTEMQWFSWWPFQAMIALLCLGMVLATLRIKLRLTNAGVWAIHTGLIVLAVSSAVYFARKVEGDAVIFHSRALVMTPGMREPESFVIRPEARAVIGPAGHRYDISVASLDPDHVMSDAKSDDRRTTAIWLNISPLDGGRRFTRRLLLGAPERTEDFLVDSGSLVPVSQRLAGRKLIDPQLQIALWYDPATHFYLHDTSAIYARFSPQDEWTELRADDVPHYYEYVDEPGAVWVAPQATPPPARPLNIATKPPKAGDALDGVDIRLTGFLPYATTQAEWIDGGDRINPMLDCRIKAPFATTTDQLLALVPGENIRRMPGATIEFRWAEPGEVRQLIEKPVPRITARVGDATKTVPLSALQGGGAVPLEGTEYSLTLKRTMPAGAAGTTAPAAVFIQVDKPGARFSRMVFEGRGDGGFDLDDRMSLTTQPADAGISLDYIDAPVDGFRVIASDDSGTLEAIRTTVGGDFEHRRIKLGEAIPIAPGLEFTAEKIILKARQETRPYIVPRHQRQPGSLARQSMSQARVQIRQGDWSQKVWLRYHDFAFADAQRAQPGRFIYVPTTVQLPDGRQLELLYSRWREPLPSPVALDRFVLKTYPGGDQPSDYISRVRFDEKGAWSDVIEVRSNQPARHGDYWYFQSQYDPRTQSHTVLGVGNRVAVGWMLAGTCLSIAGMLYAFYVKPVLIRRRNRRNAANALSGASADREPVENLVPQSDVVLK